MYRYELHLTYYSQFRSLDKLNNVAYLSAVRNLFGYLNYSIKDTCLSMKDKTIGIGNMFLYLTIYVIHIHHSGIWSTINNRLSSCNDIRRNILRECSSCLNHRIITYACLCILDN